MILFDYELTPTQGVFDFDSPDCGWFTFTVDFTEHEDGAEIDYVDFVQESESCNIRTDGNYLEAVRTIQDILDRYVLEDL